MKLSTSGLAKSEPVLVGHFAVWLLLQLGAVLVGRYHLITDATWTPLASAVEPVVSAVLLAGLAWLIRRVVAPAWKLLEQAPVVGDLAAEYGPELVDAALAAANHIFPMPGPALTPADPEQPAAGVPPSA